MKSKKSRPKLSQALIELRLRLGETQESLARRLHVSLQTVALWETKRAPKGIILFRLSKLAEGHQYADLAKIFADAVEQENRLTREDLRREDERWFKLWVGLNKIGWIAVELIQGKGPAKLIPPPGQPLPRTTEEDRKQYEIAIGKDIQRLVVEVRQLAEEAQAWSWRNQR